LLSFLGYVSIVLLDWNKDLENAKEVVDEFKGRMSTEVR